MNRQMPMRDTRMTALKERKASFAMTEIIIFLLAIIVLLWAIFTYTNWGQKMGEMVDRFFRVLP